jgi:hypothetical protein
MKLMAVEWTRTANSLPEVAMVQYKSFLNTGYSPVQDDYAMPKIKVIVGEQQRLKGTLTKEITHPDGEGAYRLVDGRYWIPD